MIGAYICFDSIDFLSWLYTRTKEKNLPVTLIKIAIVSRFDPYCELYLNVSMVELVYSIFGFYKHFSTELEFKNFFKKVAR